MIMNIENDNVLDELAEEEGSLCCGAKVVSDLCMDCKEHC